MDDVIYFDPVAKKITQISTNSPTFLGYSPKELHNLSLEQILPPFLTDLYNQILEQKDNLGKFEEHKLFHKTFKIYLITKEGHHYPCLIYLGSVPFKDVEIAAIVRSDYQDMEEQIILDD